jgi:hypothetical protein
MSVMAMRLIVTQVLMVLFFSSCFQKHTGLVSRVSEFHYGGYGDTTVATLTGHIFYLNAATISLHAEIPLQGVTIKVLENNQMVTTDSTGYFEASFYRGIFSLLITKEGYQPLLIKNYVADPDQYSGVTIYLEKGKEQQSFYISKNTKE